MLRNDRYEESFTIRLPRLGASSWTPPGRDRWHGMNYAKRVLSAITLTCAALSFSGAAQADDLAVRYQGTEETEAYDHHLTLSDRYNLVFYWSK